MGSEPPEVSYMETICSSQMLFYAVQSFNKISNSYIRMVQFFTLQISAMLCCYVTCSAVVTLTPVADAVNNLASHFGLDLYADQGTCVIYVVRSSHMLVNLNYRVVIQLQYITQSP